jgi:hypothetical protein
MKFGIKHFWSETPKVAKKIGYILLSINGAISITAGAMDCKTLSITAIICGITGKVITDLFTE